MKHISNYCKKCFIWVIVWQKFTFTFDLIDYLALYNPQRNKFIISEPRGSVG